MRGRHDKRFRYAGTVWRPKQIARNGWKDPRGHHAPRRTKNFKLRDETLHSTPFATQTKRVRHMIDSLRSSGWIIEFKVLAVSATGNRYEGQGQSAEEAFLKAVRALPPLMLLPKAPERPPAPVEIKYPAPKNEGEWERKRRLDLQEVSWGGAVRASWEKPQVAA